MVTPGGEVVVSDASLNLTARVYSARPEVPALPPAREDWLVAGPAA